MTLQETFYLVGIIFMVTATVLFVGIGVVIFLIYRQLSSIKESIISKVENITKPAELAVNVGTAVAQRAVRKVKSLINQ